VNKRIKKKIRKGKFWCHKGQFLWQHHAYQSDTRRREIMMCYDPEFGCEYYFPCWSLAKKYLRSPAVRVPTSEGSLTKAIKPIPVQGSEGLYPRNPNKPSVGVDHSDDDIPF